jgi:isoleucyl-tRNA synthetase
MMDKDAPLYPPLARKFHDAESEQLISAFWRDHEVFRRSIAQREGAPDFVFYEGPPTANGLPGVHHVMARLCKDVMCRYRTMTGHRVLRKAGWDTHGLPVERAVEKRLGIQGRRAIEAYGIERFNAACRESVWSCKSDWDEFTAAIGYWVDLDDPYVTYDPEYIESVWWILSRFGEAGLLTRGLKVVPYCTQCGTPLSSHEMANGYRQVTDPAIAVRLRAADADEHFVTWTTTPWTLPANVGLAVGPEFDYVRVRFHGETLILAEARLDLLGGADAVEVLGKLKGAELVGRRYLPLFPFLPESLRGAAFRVVPADYVTLDAGSGIVHLAPAFGEDDFQAGQTHGLPVFCPVDAEGKFTDEVPPYAGTHVKAADRRIIADLRDGGQLLADTPYTHDYPFHDRCDSPLIYYATPAWFIRTSELRQQLEAANADIRWMPPEVGQARFGNWLANNVDWSLSRNRYWGTPLNVWICDGCDAQAMPTCRADLTAWSGRDCGQLDPHRPFVDEVTFACRAGCGGTMRRTPEVIDCWFDSGAMPFAQYHYPFANRELFESQFPADFISEGIDQTRGWFYTMLVISTFLTGRSSYKSCLVHELILDREGKKMSKSQGNAVDPRDILRLEGADPLRWYLLTASPAWVPTRFDREGVKEAQRKLLATLENTYTFFTLYANLDGFVAPAVGATADDTAPALLDRWVLSRLQTVVVEARAALDELNFTRAAKAIGAFIVDDVSNWYVRLCRRRFWKGEATPDKRAAYTTLYTVLETSLRLLAPFVPFVAEELYRGLRAHADPDVSVHLADYPLPDAARRDESLEAQMTAAQEVVGLGRALRQEAGLRTRQPLGRLLVHGADGRAARLTGNVAVAALVAEELNVREVVALDDPLRVLTLAVRPNFRALGPRFGPRAPLAARRITAMSPAEAAVLRAEGRVEVDLEGERLEITAAEAGVTEAGVPPYIAVSGNGFTVALDTTLNDELVDEGLAREIINRVQNLRKKSGLAVSDRIRLAVAGAPRVERVMAAHGARITGETLAESVATEAGLPYREEFTVDDVRIVVALAQRSAEPGGES